MDLNNTHKRMNAKITYYPPEDKIISTDVDEVFATEGFVKGTKAGSIKNEDGAVVWDMKSYNIFMEDPVSPDTVNPILWSHERLNNYNGLFQVLPRVTHGGSDGKIYQIRTYDLATMTFVKGMTEHCWIVIDPLGGLETAAAAWECFKDHVDKDAKIYAILITHSHVDHYKGIFGLIEEKDILPTTQETYKEDLKNSDKVLVVAPNGFYEEAVSENLYLGNCMARRATYMYGSFLPHDEQGQVGAGLGKTVGATSGTLPNPSFELKMEAGKKTEQLLIDGLTVIFQDVPGTEAPAEFHIYFDDYKALCPGENITHTMHNLLTSRGAKVRDPKAFASAIDDAIKLFGDVEVIIGTHHWPTWKYLESNSPGENLCLKLMEKQRDMYQFFNDQVIRMVNKGMNMEEIAETFALPDSLDNELFNRGFYGSINHNVKAVVQRYVGWWDGNPANYFKYPDVEVANRFVECMGGENNVLNKAIDYFKDGDYRWVVELTKQLVFCNPANEDARFLQADALEQLAYSFENATWRNIFLSGAMELRAMEKKKTEKSSTEIFIDTVTETIKTLSPFYIFEYFSTLVKGKEAENADLEYHITIGGYDQFIAKLKNGVLRYMDDYTIVKSQMISGTTIVCISFDDVNQFAESFWSNMRNINVPDSEATTDGMVDLYRYFDILDGNWNIIEPLAKI